MNPTLAPPQPTPDDPFVSLVVFVLVLPAVAIAFAGSSDVRSRTMRVLAVYLVYSLFEVVVKRAAHFDSSVYPIKAILLVLVFLAWWTGRRQSDRPEQPAPFRRLLFAYLGLAAVQVFNPLLGNPIVGLFAWYSDFVYAFFYLMAYEVIDSAPRLRRFLSLTVGLGLLSAVAAFVEQVLGPDELLRAYPTFVRLMGLDAHGHWHVRPMSLSAFMEVFAIGAAITLMALPRARGTRLLLAMAVFVIAAGNVLHGVRLAWLMTFLITGVFVVLNFRRSALSGLALVACGGAGVSVAMTLGQSAVEVRLRTLETPFETFSSERLGGLLALVDVLAAHPFGLGPGRTSPGLRFVGTDYAALGTHNYVTDLAGQLSVLGPILLLAFCARVLWRGSARLRGLPDESRRVLGAGALAIVGAVAISFLLSGALGSFPLSEYFWFLAGAAMRAAHGFTSRGRPAATVPETVSRGAPGQTGIRTREPVGSQ